MTTNDAVAARVLTLLKEMKMTQYRLEQNSGIRHGAMDGILNSKYNTVTLSTLYKLAQGFGMTLHEFLDDDIFFSEDIEYE